MRGRFPKHTTVDEIEIRKDILGTYLKQSREKAGLSQRDVATSLGYSTAQFISNWERGQASPPLNVFPKLADLYNLKVDEIIEVVQRYHLKVLEEQKAALLKHFKKVKA